MAAISIPAPGTKYGPCEKDCDHPDCAANRKDAALVCVLCGKPIGYDKDCYLSGEHTPCHAVCIWTKLKIG